MIFCKYQNCCNFIVSILGANVTGDLYNVTGGGRENDMASLTHCDAAKVTAPECQHHHRTGQDNRTSKRQDQHWERTEKNNFSVAGSRRHQRADSKSYSGKHESQDSGNSSLSTATHFSSQNVYNYY